MAGSFRLGSERPLQFFKLMSFNVYLNQILQMVWAWHYPMENHPFLLVYALNLKNKEIIHEMITLLLK